MADNNATNLRIKLGFPEVLALLGTFGFLGTLSNTPIIFFSGHEWLWSLCAFYSLFGAMFFKKSSINLCMPERLAILGASGFLGFLGFLPGLHFLKGLFGLFFPWLLGFSGDEEKSLLRPALAGKIAMAGKGRQTARKPATRFAHLRKKMEKNRIASKIGEEKK